MTSDRNQSEPGGYLLFLLPFPLAQMHPPGKKLDGIIVKWQRRRGGIQEADQNNNQYCTKYELVLCILFICHRSTTLASSMHTPSRSNSVHTTRSMHTLASTLVILFILESTSQGTVNISTRVCILRTYYSSTSQSISSSWTLRARGATTSLEFAYY